MSSSASIPPRLVQTARSRDLPPLSRAAARNLQLLHPDWEYCFFDDADVARFVADEFPQYRDVFEGFPHKIQRYDFFRYLAILRHGGFYFDLDVFLSEPLGDLAAHRCVFPFEELTLNRYLRERGMDWEIGNYGFGAAPDHPFLAAVVENCVRAQRDRTWADPLLRDIPLCFRSGLEVLYTTGPGMLTRTLADNPRLAATVTIIYPETKTGAADLCDERNWHRFGRYGVHLMEASWRERGGFLRRKAALLWETHRRKRALAAIRAAGTPRALPLAQAS